MSSFEVSENVNTELNNDLYTRPTHNAHSYTDTSWGSRDHSSGFAWRGNLNTNNKYIIEISVNNRQTRLLKSDNLWE